MPGKLLKGKRARSTKAISRNIRTLMTSDRKALTAKGKRQKQKQAVAIAFSLAGKSRKRKRT